MRSKQKRSDPYSPKDKDNTLNGKLFIGGGLLIGLVVLIIIYKLFLTGSSSEMPLTVDRYEEQKVDYEGTSVNGDQAGTSVKNREFVDNMPPHPDFQRKNKEHSFLRAHEQMRAARMAARDGGMDDEGDGSKMDDGIAAFREKMKSHKNMPNLNNLKGGFGDLGNMRAMFDKHGKRKISPQELRAQKMKNFEGVMPNMDFERPDTGNLFGRHFDTRGDGPIFNDLNDDVGRMSREELMQHKAKLKANMHHMGKQAGRMGNPFQRGGAFQPGAFGNFGGQRREEM